MLKKINNAWKDEQLRSSLVFYTISLKQISPLTLSLWCFETLGCLPPRIKWSNNMKMKHSGSCSTNYSMPLSLSLTQKGMNQKFLTGRVFSEKFFFMNEGLWNYTWLQTKTLFQRLLLCTDSDSIIKNKIKYYY